MKSIFLTLVILLQFSMFANAGRESHGFAPEYQVRCNNPDGTGTKIIFEIAQKPVYAEVISANNESVEFSCKGKTTLLCTNVKSDLTIQLNQSKNPMTALIFQNRRLFEKVPCN